MTYQLSNQINIGATNHINYTTALNKKKTKRQILKQYNQNLYVSSNHIKINQQIISII